MQPLKPSEFVTYYLLVKQSGSYLSTCGYSSHQSGAGTGFFFTLAEAEQYRLKEILSRTDEKGYNDIYFIYELEVPNPAYTK